MVSKGPFSFVCVLFFILDLFVIPTKACIDISYSLEDMGLNRWKATYQIDNRDTSFGVQWLSVFYDYGLYEAIQIETLSPLAEQWNQTVWDPKMIDSLPIPGLYDVQALTGGIMPGQSLSGFAVSFIWTQEGMPIVPQRFEVYNNMYDLQYPWVGTTVYIPEPTSMLVLGVGVLLGMYFRFDERRYS